MPASPPGYSVQKGDCGYPVCDTITPGPVHAPNASVLAAICNNTDGCEGFNSNGWLKRCLPPRCAKAKGGMEPSAPSWLYTKLAAPKPSPPPPPPPPVAARPDLHYPLEERAELARLRSPTASKIKATSGTAVLSDGGTSAVVSEGAVFGGWTVLSILPEPACVVLEHLFANFALFNTWISAYDQTMTIVPYALAAPLMFAAPGNRITLGTLMQVSNAFDKVFGAMAVVSENWAAVNDFRSTVHRLREFERHVYARKRFDHTLLRDFDLTSTHEVPGTPRLDEGAPPVETHIVVELAAPEPGVFRKQVQHCNARKAAHLLHKA